ncbi:hypothetical protein FRX31_027463, partial [Thalictrum thalictroides]
KLEREKAKKEERLKKKKQAQYERNVEILNEKGYDGTDSANHVSAALDDSPTRYNESEEEDDDNTAESVYDEGKYLSFFGNESEEEDNEDNADKKGGKKI